VRLLLAAAVAALVAVAGLLFLEREAEDRSTRTAAEPPPPEAPAPPEPPADVEAVARARPRDPATQEALSRFARDCAARGADAVPHLVDLLRNRPDVTLEPRWRFEEGRLAAYPTLRAAYIDALARIPGVEATTALLEVLDLTASVHETRQIAAALEARGELRWLPVALRRASEDDSPTTRESCDALVELAARADPSATAAQIVALAPRGTGARDPRTLARGLRALPLESAVATGEQLLADASVSPKAKARYVDTLCGRDEPAVFAHLRGMMERGAWSLPFRLHVASAATRAKGFYRDQVALGIAEASSRSEEAREAKRRYATRLREVTLLVEATIAELPPDDPRAVGLRRALARHRKTLE